VRISSEGPLQSFHPLPRQEILYLPIPVLAWTLSEGERPSRNNPRCLHYDAA